MTNNNLPRTIRTTKRNSLMPFNILTNRKTNPPTTKLRTLHTTTNRHVILMPLIINRQKPILITQNSMIQPQTLRKRTILNLNPYVNHLSQILTRKSLRMFTNLIYLIHNSLILLIHLMLKSPKMGTRETPSHHSKPLTLTVCTQNIRQKYTWQTLQTIPINQKTSPPQKQNQSWNKTPKITRSNEQLLKHPNYIKSKTNNTHTIKPNPIMQVSTQTTIKTAKPTTLAIRNRTITNHLKNTMRTKSLNRLRIATNIINLAKIMYNLRKFLTELKLRLTRILKAQTKMTTK